MGVRNSPVDFRVFSMKYSKVYLYEECHSHTQVVGKFFVKGVQTTAEAIHRMQQEFENLQLLRGYGLSGYRHLVVRPLGTNAWLFKQKSAALSDFTFFLTGGLDREVVDLTGLEGTYSFNLDWKEENAEDWVQGPRGMMHDPQTIFRVVKRIGLKMEARRSAMKFLIVDHVNRDPTPN